MEKNGVDVTLMLNSKEKREEKRKETKYKAIQTCAALQTLWSFKFLIFNTNCY